MNHLEGFKSYLELKGSVQSEKTIEAYTRYVRQYMTWLERSFGEPFVKLHRVNIVEYRSFAKQRGRNETFNRKHTALKSFNAYLIETGIQEDMVVRDIDRLSEERKVTSPTKASVEDYRQMAHKIRNSTSANAVRDAAMVWTILGTGMRVSECCDVKISDVHFTPGGGGKIFVREGKGGPARWVLFSPRVRVELETYMEKRAALYPSAAEDLHLFVSRQSKQDAQGNPVYRVDRRTVSTVFKKYRHRDCMTVHQARHVHLTWLSKKSGIENAAGQAGNKVASMNTYLHSSEEELEQDINDFE